MRAWVRSTKLRSANRLPKAALARWPLCHTPLGCRFWRTKLSGLPQECRRCRATTRQTPKLHSLGFGTWCANASAQHRPPEGSARANTNRHRGPSPQGGFHKNACARRGRAWTNTASVQLFFADAGDRGQHSAELLHLCDGFVHLGFHAVVGQDDEVGVALALARFTL